MIGVMGGRRRGRRRFEEGVVMDELLGPMLIRVLEAWRGADGVLYI